MLSTNAFKVSLSGEQYVIIRNEDGSFCMPEELKQWKPYGSALKPAWEPIIVAMKPLDGTFAANAERHGVAGLNIDGGRIGTDSIMTHGGGRSSTENYRMTKEIGTEHQGRWPANLVLDEEAGKLLDEQSGPCKTGALTGQPRVENKIYGAAGNTLGKPRFYVPDAATGASRFFYCAKSSKSERNEGCEELEEKIAGGLSGRADGSLGTQTKSRNTHPTVKPLKLMEYLCTLTKTPTGGVVLDPFAGSGTTLLAAKNTGREYIGIEQNPDYYGIIKARLGLK